MLAFGTGDGNQAALRGFVEQQEDVIKVCLLPVV